MVDCTTFMDESFDGLHKFSDAFNVSPFIPVVVGMVITHHSLLTSLWVNVSQFPLKIFLLPLTSNTTVVLGQMALLSYVARQSVTVQERQAQLKPIPRTGTGEMDPTLESNHGSNVGLNPQKLKWDQVGLTPSKKDQLEAQCFHQTLHEEILCPHRLCHLWQRNTTLLKARMPIPTAQWPPYWHNFNKVSTVNRGMCHLRAHQPRIPRQRMFPQRMLPRRILPKRVNRHQPRNSSCQTSPLNHPLKSNGPAPPAVIKGAKLITARQTKARRKRRGRRKSLRVSPPWLQTQKLRKLKSSKKNASRRGSGRRSCRH